MINARWRASLHSSPALLFAVVALVALALLPALVGSSVFYVKDIELWFQPSRVAYRASLLAGDFPLWQPQIGLGQPAAANPAQSAFYPGNVFLLLADAGAVSRFLALHVLLATAGTWALARQLGRSPAAAAVAALSFGFGGYTLSMATWSGTYLLSIAWMPLVVWLGLRAADGGRNGVAACGARAALFAVALACQILTGELQGVGFTLVTLAALVATGGGPRRELAASITAVVIAVVVAALLAMPQLLPTLDLLSDSGRSGGVPLEEAQRLSLHPARFAELVVAGLFGSPLDSSFLGGFMTSTSNAVARTPWMLSPYQGALALPLAILGAVVAWRSRDRRHLALVAVAIFAALFALGRHTPVHGLASWLPGIDLFRYPAKYMAAVSLALALLAARGVDAAVESELRWKRLFRVVIAVAAVIVCAAGLARWVASAGAIVADAALLRTAALFAVASMSMFLVKARRARLGALALCGVFVGDLAVSNLGLVRVTDAALYRAPSLLADVIGSDHRASPHLREWPRVIVDPDVFARGRGIDIANTEIAAQQIKQALTPNTATPDGLAYPLPYSASLDETHRRWVEATGDMQRVAMNIYGIRYVVVPGMAAMNPGLDLEQLATLPERNVSLFRNTRARPLAYPADPVRFASDVDEAYAVVHERGFMGDHGAVVHIASESSSDLATEIGGARGECELERRPGDSIELRCRLDRHGWVIISVAHHRGWAAHVDGHEAAIHRANGFVMAVAVAPGDHEIRLDYHQPGLAAGLWLAALGLLGLLALIAVSWRARLR